MNALTPRTPNALPAKPTLPALSPGLTQWLMASGNSDDVIHHLMDSPGLHAEAVASLPALEAYTTRAGVPGVKAALGKLFAIYPQQDRSEIEWAVWWEIYIEDLANLPQWALEEAARQYRRKPDSEFFPKPGMLRDLAGRIAAPAAYATYRAKVLSRTPIRPAISKDDAETRAKALAGIVADALRHRGA